MHFTHGRGNAPARRDVGNVLSIKPIRNGEHPTEKPVELLAKLVDVVCPVGGTTLDPFMGSGATGVGCAKLGRKFVGIEMEPKYFDLACRRIEEAYKQADMFSQASLLPAA